LNQPVGQRLLSGEKSNCVAIDLMPCALQRALNEGSEQAPWGSTQVKEAPLEQMARAATIDNSALLKIVTERRRPPFLRPKDMS
jgi:hypothetical protein